VPRSATGLSAGVTLRRDRHQGTEGREEVLLPELEQRPRPERASQISPAHHRRMRTGAFRTYAAALLGFLVGVWPGSSLESLRVLHLVNVPCWRSRPDLARGMPSLLRAISACLNALPVSVCCTGNRSSTDGASRGVSFKTRSLGPIQTALRLCVASLGRECPAPEWHAFC
jgi:hypothetical protein